MKNLLFLFPALILFYSCQTPEKKEEHKDSVQTPPAKDSVKVYKPFLADSAFVANLKPEFGYRFVIRGDFDGDGKQETLTEHYFSGVTNKETCKYYEGINYDTLIDICCSYINPYTFLLSNNKNIDSLNIGNDCRVLGFAFLKNEGDLNGDGTDEISYVANYGDWSSVNTCHLMTYKNKQWIELYAIPMWEWQIPPLPGTNMQYGLFGAQDLVVTENDTLNQRLEKEFKQFPGFIKKISKNKIEVYYKNKLADMDTAIIDLKAPVSIDELDKDLDF